MSNKAPKYSGRTTASTVLKDVDLNGKTIFITGTTAGIGRETARSLAVHGAHVVMANRNVKLSEELRDEIYKETTLRKIDIIQLDLNSLASVKRGAEEFLAKGWPLDILILNAGVNNAPEKTTKDGYEATFGINHLGHFYLTYLLLDKLRQSAPSRLVVVSSGLHARTGIKPNLSVDEKLSKLIPDPTANTGMMSAIGMYNLSKLCNVLFAFKIHRMECEHGIHTYVLHPGVIPTTSLSRNFYPWLVGFFAFISKPFTKNFEQGAATTVYCAASPYTENESGQYYADCASAEKDLHKALARDETLQDALWEKSLEYVKKFEENISAHI